MHRWQRLMVQVVLDCSQAGLRSLLSCLHLPQITASQLTSCGDCACGVSGAHKIGSRNLGDIQILAVGD